MKEFGIQLYSCRDCFSDERACQTALSSLKASGYSYVQTAGMYENIPTQALANALKNAGLFVCGTHYDYDKILHDFKGTVAYHTLLNTKNIGIGGMPQWARTPHDDGLDRFIDEWNEAAKRYALEGFTLTYHHHAFEFLEYKNTGKSTFDYLVDGLDRSATSFVLDTYWLQYADVDILQTLRRLQGRVAILHLKDMVKNPTLVGEADISAITHLGSGTLPFKEIIPLAKHTGVQYFVVEDDRCVQGESLLEAKKSAEYLKANF